MSQITNQIFSILTVLANLMTLFIIFSSLTKKNEWLKKINSYALPLTFSVALLATLGSLTYSEIIGYEPCKLCWFQRVFFYPQVILLAIAWFKKETYIFKYIFTLSAIGAIVAFYHYLLQIGAAPNIGCDAIGYSVSCSKNFVLRFNYITIPMMALSGFILNAVISLIGMKKYKETNLPKGDSPQEES